MSFGFRRRPTTAPSIASNSSAARRLANADVANGNGTSDTDPLTSNIAPSGRTTPRLMPPKKEATAIRVNRFGFRQPQTNRLNKVADLNSPPGEFCNNNIASRPRHNANTQTASNVGRCNNNTIGGCSNSNRIDNNKNRLIRFGSVPPTQQQHQAERFTLQSTQLPGPQSIRMIESKTAKTLANTNKKISATAGGYHEDNSSKDGSLTEDSGVSSHISSNDVNNGHRVEHLDSSPTFGVRRNSHIKSRNLEVVISGNTFDVRDLDDLTDNCTPLLPQLPSAFNTDNNKRSTYQNSGFVREKALEYQRHLDADNRRKISITSSEGFSDDYGEEEKTYIDRYRSEKSFIKPTMHRTFLKSRSTIKDDSSPPSSDEHEWVGHGGEAMAEDTSFSISSSDESKDRDQLPIRLTNTIINSALLDMKNATCYNNNNNNNNTVIQTVDMMQDVMLTIEDPQFAAIAEASNSSTLLDDETSPVDSLLSCSETEEILKRKLTSTRRNSSSTSNSKDINEKLTPPSPGTPTNASNSLSLSDGKDDFLIDDEIADQPALLCEETLTMITANDNGSNYNSISQNNSESTPTIVDSTPKPKRRTLNISVDGSPLPVRTKKFLHSRTGSLDTLSPCESIASDDLMMDFDYSSGVEDFDRTERHVNNSCLAFDDTLTNQSEVDINSKSDKLRDWCSLLGNYNFEKSTKCNAARPARLLRSRASTPTSIPDSPRSVNGNVATKSRPLVTSSPLRRSRPGNLSSTGYESDESIKLDRTNYTAIKQDIMSVKTMLLKVRRVLNESETHMPFDGQLTLTNGLFNGLCSNIDAAQNQEDVDDDGKMELSELRKQVLFLQGQLEDKEKAVVTLQEQVIKLASENYTSNSAPASTTFHHTDMNIMCNAATQTERMRPISAGPSLFNGSSPVDGNVGSLVSASELSQRRSRPPLQSDSPSTALRTPSRLWRKPGEPPSPQRYTSSNNNSSSIPRRANSRTRTPSTPS